MQNYSEFPPVKYFVRVLKGCPKSALLYVQVWKNKSEQGNLLINKNDVRRHYLISPTMFRNLLAPLMFLSLIRFVEGDDHFQINISGHVND